MAGRWTDREADRQINTHMYMYVYIIAANFTKYKVGTDHTHHKTTPPQFPIICLPSGKKEPKQNKNSGRK